MKSEFLSPLRVSENADDSGAVLLIDFRYYSERLGREIVVPAGFETDYASVPRLPFAYSLFGGVAKWAAVIHDYLYRTATASRADADAVFLEAMEASAVGSWRRYPMWAGVRLFGWTAYPDGKKVEVPHENDSHPFRSDSGS